MLMKTHNSHNNTTSYTYTTPIHIRTCKHTYTQAQTVSFHMILASMEGSTETYALLLYANIGWDESIITKDVTVGFNTGESTLLKIIALESCILLFRVAMCFNGE